MRILLSMQGTLVQSLVRELRFHMPWDNQAHALQQEKPAHHNEKYPVQQKKEKKRKEKKSALDLGSDKGGRRNFYGKVFLEGLWSVIQIRTFF